MNTRTAFNIISLLGFGLIIFGAIGKYYHIEASIAIIFVGMGLTTIASFIRFRYLRRKRNA